MFIRIYYYIYMVIDGILAPLCSWFIAARHPSIFPEKCSFWFRLRWIRDLPPKSSLLLIAPCRLVVGLRWFGWKGVGIMIWAPILSPSRLAVPLFFSLTRLISYPRQSYAPQKKYPRLRMPLLLASRPRRWYLVVWPSRNEFSPRTARKIFTRRSV